jgi:hypothetical protein
MSDKLYLQVEHEEMLLTVQEAAARAGATRGSSGACACSTPSSTTGAALRLFCRDCGHVRTRAASCDVLPLRLSAAEALQDLVTDRKEELKQLHERCWAMERDNTLLRIKLGADPQSPVAADTSAEKLATLQLISVPAFSESREFGRIRGQCEALRQVLRQREDEVGKERERNAQLRTAIKAAQKEYAKNMTRLQFQLKNLQQERHAQKERIQVQQQQIDDARQQVHAEKKSLSALRALTEALKIDLQRARAGWAQELFLQVRQCAPVDEDPTARSPRGADDKMKSPRSPRGPGCENMSVPALRLEHLAHSNNSSVTALRGDMDQAAPAESPRSIRSTRLPPSPQTPPRHGRSPSRDGDVASLAAKLGEMERKYKKECAARRADQLAMMEHIKSEGMEKLNISQELATKSHRCKGLELQLAEMRFRMQRSNAAGLHRDSAKSFPALEPEEQPGEEQDNEKSQAPPNFFSSLLGAFDIKHSRKERPKWRKPQEPAPGMDSPRGERISGCPIQEAPIPIDHQPVLIVHSSPSVAFPLDTITEWSPEVDTSPTISSADLHDALSPPVPFEAKTGDYNSGDGYFEQKQLFSTGERGPRTAVALGGGTHTSLRGPERANWTSAVGAASPGSATVFCPGVYNGCDLSIPSGLVEHSSPQMPSTVHAAGWSLRDAGCSPLSRAEAHDFTLEPTNTDWRVIL